MPEMPLASSLVCLAALTAAATTVTEAASPPSPGYSPVPAFLPHFTPALHLPTTYGSGAHVKADGMQDPAGNLQLADGTYHVFPCCRWEHFSSTDLVHWDRVGHTNLGGGTGSMAIREDNSVVAMRPSRGMSMSVSDDSAGCAGPDCLSNWTDLGSVLSAPPGGSSAGFRDPARPWKSSVDGHWYQVMGGGQRGAEAQGLLYRALNASLLHWDFVTQVLTANRTVGFGRNEGFFDMMECPDFFPLGQGGSQRWVFISSCYLGSQPPYPHDGFHNSVTWWIGTWSPTTNGGKMVVEASGLVDWGAVTYYSAKSLAGPNDDEPTRLLGGWVMDANGASEPRLCKNRDSSSNGLAWVICPEALHREVYLCTNSTTAKPAMCQRPAPQLRALRAKQPVSAKISTCGHPGAANYTLPLPISGLQLELHLNLSFCKSLAAAVAVSGEVGLGVLQSSSGDEITRIGYNLASRTLFIDRERSSTLPAAVPGGGALKSTGKQGYGIRAREVAPLPEVTAFDNRNHPSPSDADSLQLVVLLDHSIVTVFANDAVVISTRVYTAGGNASGEVSFFAESLEGVGVKGSVTVWPLLKSDDGDASHQRVVVEEDDLEEGDRNSTCTLYANTGVTTGHDVARAAATTAQACMEACERNSLCCIGEFDSKHAKCYLKSGGLLVAIGRRPGTSSFNCTGSVSTCYHPVGPHPVPPPTPPAPPVPVTVTVDATALPTPFPPFWKRSFGSGHARLSLRPDWQKHLTQAVSELGPSSSRNPVQRAL